MQHITLDGFSLDVQEQGDIRALILTEVNPPSGNRYILPLPKDVAADVGKKLQGSAIEVAPASALRAIKGGKG